MTVRVGNRSYIFLIAIYSSGVPQGGALSPLLFLIYTLDLPKILKVHPSIEVKMFADDIRIYCVYDSHEQPVRHKMLSLSIEKMVSWSTDWELPLNLEKTVHLHLGPCPPIPYQVDGTFIKLECSVKDLGILFDVRLAFDEHIEMVVKKAIRCLFLVLRNVQCNDPSLLVRLYNIYIRPHLEYGSIVWSPWMKKHENRLERVQKTFTRLAFYRCFPNSEYPQALPVYQDRLRALNMRSLKYRRIFSDLREIKLAASKYWIFRPYRRVECGITIHYKKLERHRFNVVFHSFFFRAARWLRMLPHDMLSCSNSKEFKARLKKSDIFRILKVEDVR
ncbi:hypothetical protein COOONC_09116 [Cooperia oncophora]